MKHNIMLCVLLLSSTTLTPLIITSDAFTHKQPIPKKYTCQGKNVSPMLAWDNIPKQTKSFVLICDDPDAPGGTWVHWVLYDLPAIRSRLSQNTNINKKHTGSNSWGNAAYGGPCPPSGTHHYFFKLYALSIPTIGLPPGATKAQVEQAMKGHIITQATLMGTYKKTQE